MSLQGEAGTRRARQSPDSSRQASCRSSRSPCPRAPPSHRCVTADVAAAVFSILTLSEKCAEPFLAVAMRRWLTDDGQYALVGEAIVPYDPYRRVADAPDPLMKPASSWLRQLRRKPVDSIIRHIVVVPEHDTETAATAGGLDLFASIAAHLSGGRESARLSCTRGLSDACQIFFNLVGEVATRRPRQIVCLLRWLQDLVVEGHRRQADDTAEAVRLLKNALITAEGRESSCATHVRAFLKDKQDKARAAVVAVDAAIAAAKHLLKIESWARTQHGFKELAAECVDLLRPYAEVIKHPTEAFDSIDDTVAFLRDTAVAALESHAQELRSRLFPKVNARGEDVFVTYLFLGMHLTAIRSALDSGGLESSHEVQAFLDHVTPTSASTIQNQCLTHAKSLVPVIKFLREVYDDDLPTSLVAGRICALAETLEKQPRTCIGRAVGVLMRQALFDGESDSSEVNYDDIRETYELLWHASLFRPGHPLHRHPSFVQRLSSGMLSASAVAAQLNLHEAELPAAEWDSWLDAWRVSTDCEVGEISFWESPDSVERYPHVSKVAQYILRLPFAMSPKDASSDDIL